VSENSIKEAQGRRKEEWAKAYERLGQKPPEDEGPAQKYDPRSLYEKLQEQKMTKQAAFEEKTSIRNQFRALDDEETAFLSNALDEKRALERERQAEIDAELARFREAVTAKQSTAEPSPSAISPPLATTTPSSALLAGSASPPNPASTTASSSTSKLPPPKKKSGLQQKGLLAGAIKRKSSGGEKEKEKIKKPAPSSPAGSEGSSKKAVPLPSEKPEVASQPKQDDIEGGTAKKRKVDSAEAKA